MEKIEKGVETSEGTVAARGTEEPAGLDPATTTVHEAMGRISGAGEVFRRFGLDTCCGGDLPLEEAARHHGVDLDRLLAALEAGGGRG